MTIRQNSPQHGTALFTTLVMLVIMTIAALGLLKIVDGSNIIAGNLAFRQTVLQATDYGFASARTILPQRLTSFTDANKPSTGPVNYYPFMQETAQNGFPNVKWNEDSEVPKLPSSETAYIPSTLAEIYIIKGIIERLCVEPPSGVALNADNFMEYCFADDAQGIIPVSNSGGPPPKMPEGYLTAYFRVTVHATGPRNTTVITQGIFANQHPTSP